MQLAFLQGKAQKTAECIVGRYDLAVVVVYYVSCRRILIEPLVSLLQQLIFLHNPFHLFILEQEFLVIDT